ncbi:phosphate ABC transporter substrate-binding protein (PhoT family) [Ulvibacter sp. MAR_2010_11]|uniref:PstS family phosphate ABC transporter substrate-binding protein n=1 Tax=Ulvibacter sp. MAR_2010_11 TaxID=1250229 RepID=UPI000C2CB4ED|nr:PstS family phosphate ABC transporter substrate-binding protein [Ulvibacter sp. MAR_2010_11]PKA83154.1 phosphate ABC transporter substrate-binding protein (PhoT family) [Ulvibacter sp. MAR_2010_11]
MKKIVSIIAIALIFGACGEKKENGESAQNDAAALSGTIKVDGSSTVFPITEAVAEEFRAVQPDVKVTVGVSGTGGGFQKFSRGETNISNASRPIKDKEIAACAENNIKYIQLEVAYDGLAVLVNPENTWVDSFTVEELKKIWEPAAQGKIMKWNQIRPEWPNEEIHLFGPGVASGTYDYFTEAVVGKSGSSRGDFTASEDDHVLVQGIAGDKYSLGFFGLAYYSENQDKLTLIGVHNGTEVVKPSLETVKNGRYSPLSRPLFIYVNSTSVASSEVVEFVNFYLDNAGDLATDVGYIPLPAELYASQKENFRTFVESNK